MSRASAAAEIPPALTARLHAPLLALHAAMEVAPLWRAVQKVMRAAFAPHRVTLFLGHLGMGEARVVLTEPPIAHPEEWYAARGKLNPFSPFIARHRRLKFYRFNDVLPPKAEFVRTEFYRRFAEPEGWDKGVSALFWSRNEVTAMFSLYRSPAQPEFSDTEMAMLAHLYPFIGTAIARVRRLHSERLARRGLEDFNHHLPVGLLSLDWNLRVEFANPEAQRLCGTWNFGIAAAKALSPRDTFAVPVEILAACRHLRAQAEAGDPRQPAPGTSRVVAPPATGLRAHVTVLNNSASALAPPRFLIALDARAAPASDQTIAATAASRLGQLRELTPREREIALLVAEGHSNAEVARRLSRSVLTVKTQLNSVFRKLGLHSRAQLIARLR